MRVLIPSWKALLPSGERQASFQPQCEPDVSAEFTGVRGYFKKREKERNPKFNCFFVIFSFFLFLKKI